MAEIAVLGAGVMGSAMAVPAAACGHRIALVGTHLDGDIIASVARDGHHPRLGLKLPAAVTPHPWTDFAAVAARGPDLVILGVSSAGVRWAIDRLVESLPGPVPVLMITKGLAPGGGRIDAFPDVVAEAVAARRGFALPVMAIGGPCIAGELAAERDTTVVFTGRDRERLARTAALFRAPFYHAHLSGDVVGVEVCAAFKNFYALSVGWVTGRLEREGRARNGANMHNLAAGLFAQAVAEMAVLSQALGGEAASAFGLPGAGDLYVTCMAGRNSRMGRLLGLGQVYSRAKADHMAQDTVEGAELALALGPALRALLAEGRLDGARLPLMQAILSAVCDDRPMAIDFTALR